MSHRGGRPPSSVAVLAALDSAYAAVLDPSAPADATDQLSIHIAHAMSRALASADEPTRKRFERSFDAECLRAFAIIVETFIDSRLSRLS